MFRNLSKSQLVTLLGAAGLTLDEVVVKAQSRSFATIETSEDVVAKNTQVIKSAQDNIRVAQAEAKEANAVLAIIKNVS